MKDTTIAVGLAKNVFEIAISREAGKVSKQLRVSRPKLVSFFAKQSAATVLLEACGSAHFWARTLRRLGRSRALLAVINPNRKIFEARKRETAALGAGEKLVLGHPLAATIGDSARCMQNLEKMLFTGPKTSDTVTFICD